MTIGERGLSAIIASILISGCSQTANKCANFPSEYVRNDITISRLGKAPPGLPGINVALSTIRYCYPSHNYMGFNNKLEIRDVLKYSDDIYLVIAELDGVSDLMIMFKIDKGGRVVRSYQRSTQ